VWAWKSYRFARTIQLCFLCYAVMTMSKLPLTWQDSPGYGLQGHVTVKEEPLQNSRLYLEQLFKTEKKLGLQSAAEN